MRKFIFILMCLCCMNAVAQVEVQVGAGFSNFCGEDIRTNKHNNNWKLMVGYDLYTTGNLTIQAMGGLDVKGNDDTRLWYITVPVTANYRIGKVLEVDLGPYVSYAYHARTPLLKNYADVTFESFDLFKHFDAGAICRVKANIDKHWYFGIDYSYGFTDISKTPMGHNAFGRKIHNTTYAAIIGFRL